MWHRRDRDKYKEWTCYQKGAGENCKALEDYVWCTKEESWVSTWYNVLLVIIRAGNCTDWKRGFGIPRLRFFIILAEVVDFLILLQVSVEEERKKERAMSQDLLGVNFAVNLCSTFFPSSEWLKICFFKLCKHIFQQVQKPLKWCSILSLILSTNSLLATGRHTVFWKFKWGKLLTT